MLLAAELTSIFLTLAPMLVALAARSRRDRQAWEIALDIPFIVAVDLLTILLLALACKLETSILISRALWLAAGLAWTARKFRRKKIPEWPRALGPRQVLAVASCTAAAVFVSLQISRPYRIGDHNWHDGLVPAITGQKLPFLNVYDPRRSSIPFHRGRLCRDPANTVLRRHVVGSGARPSRLRKNGSAGSTAA